MVYMTQMCLFFILLVLFNFPLSNPSIFFSLLIHLAHVQKDNQMEVCCKSFCCVPLGTKKSFLVEIALRSLCLPFLVDGWHK